MEFSHGGFELVYFFHGSMKKFHEFPKRESLHTSLSCIKTKVAIKFEKKLFWPKIGLVLKGLTLVPQVN